MFTPAGLGSHSDRLAWHEAMLTTHQRRVRMHVLHLDHSKVTADWHAVIDGQVSVDTTSDVISTCNLTLLDPSQSISWEPNGPNDFPQIHRMIQVFDERFVPALNDWVSCPVFCGPVTPGGFDRDGATVSITAESKVRLAMGNFGSPHTWKAKRKVTDVIHDMLVNYAGEDDARIHLPSIKATIPRKLTVHQTDTIWQHVVRLVHSVGMICFYDARGHFVMRHPSNSAGMSVDRRALCSAVRIDAGDADIMNRWIVRGPKPKAHKQRITVDLRLPVKHQWSAQSLGRNGHPRWLIDVQEPGQIKNRAAAEKLAKQKRDDQLRNSSQISADLLPMPQIEPYDLVRFVDPLIGTYSVRANQYTLPLGTGGPATFGAIKRVSLQPKNKGRKHHHRHSKGKAA